VGLTTRNNNKYYDTILFKISDFSIRVLSYLALSKG